MESQVNNLIEIYLEEKSLSLAHINREEKKLLFSTCIPRACLTIKMRRPTLQKSLIARAQAFTTILNSFDQAPC